MPGASQIKKASHLTSLLLYWGWVLFEFEVQYIVWINLFKSCQFFFGWRIHDRDIGLVYRPTGVFL